MDYIHLLTEKIDSINRELQNNPNDVVLLFERGKLHKKQGEIHKALNDFIRVKDLEPSHIGAITYIDMINNIFEFRYSETYNL